MSNKTKKSGSNAFYVFMLEYRDRNSKTSSLHDVNKKCDELWAKMSPSEREPYAQRANRAKSHTTQHQLLTNNRIPITHIQKSLDEHKEYEYTMIENVHRVIHSAGRNLANTRFYIVHMNTFCYVHSAKRHYPAEIALCRFSLRNGVEEVYHEFCRPGPFPMGYAAEVKAKSEGSHEIAPPDSGSYAKEEANLKRVFTNVLRFLKTDEKTLPYIYAYPNNLDVAFDVIATMCKDYGYPEKYLKIYSLSLLFSNLLNAVSSCSNISSASSEIERDIYSYCLNISCQFHENSGVQLHCSKSLVTRMAYVICENCCPHLGIQLIPGQHVPKNVKIKSIARPSVGSGRYETDGEKKATTYLEERQVVLVEKETSGKNEATINHHSACADMSTRLQKSVGRGRFVFMSADAEW